MLTSEGKVRGREGSLNSVSAVFFVQLTKAIESIFRQLGLILDFVRIRR